MIRKVDMLKDDCRRLLWTEYALFGGLMILIAIFGYFLTKSISNSIVTPIDKLEEILQRLINHDLTLDIMEQYEPGPPEIDALYEVFDKLRVVLKLNDPSQFRQETNALMNYAQALNLFRDFRNKKAMELCYRELGNIHFRCERFQEAALSYYNSYRLAKQIEGFSESEMARRKTQTAKTMLIAGVRRDEAMDMFNEALVFYINNSIDSIDIVLCLLDKVEGLFAIGEIPEDVLNEAEKIIKRRFSVNLQDILQQRYLYFRAMQYETKKEFQTACRLYVMCLEGFMEYDPIIRKKTLDRLIRIFKKKNLPTDGLVSLKAEMIDKSKDLALIVDTRLDSVEMNYFMLELISKIVDPKDRLSIINYDDEFHVHFNLTKKPTKNIKFPKLDLINQTGKTLLYDGVNAGLDQLFAFKSINSTFFLGKEDIPHKYLILICSDGDNGSQMNEVLLKSKIAETGVIFIALSIHSNPDSITKLESVISISSRGLMLTATSIIEIEKSFHKLAAFICPSKLFLIN